MSASLQEFLFADDPEQVLRKQYSARIAETRAAGGGARHRPAGPRLRVLLAGYSGASNTGADVRTGEIVRQLRTLLGPQGVEIGAISVAPSLPAEWGDVTPEPITGHLPAFVHDVCSRYDAVVVCEGSLFTSTFSDGLAALLTTFLGMAAAQGKPAVAYGAEADAMTPETEAFVRSHAAEALVIARNAPSCDRLRALGLRAELGTDTGWTFAPKPPVPPRDTLRALGWDGRAAVMALCPVNPFCWPLKPDPQRAMMLNLQGRRDPEHYGGVSFFRPQEETESRFTAFLDAVAVAVRRHAATRAEGVFPVVIGMEALDRAACEGLAQRLDAPPPVIAGTVDPHTIIGLLHAADRLVSARYHAVLLSMPAAVPAVGLAYDQRLPALLAEAERPDLILSVDDPALEDRLLDQLDSLQSGGDAVARAFAALARRQQGMLDGMGARLRAHLTGVSA